MTQPKKLYPEFRWMQVSEDGFLRLVRDRWGYTHSHLGYPFGSREEALMALSYCIDKGEDVSMDSYMLVESYRVGLDFGD